MNQKKKRNWLPFIIIIPVVIFGAYVCYDKFLTDNVPPVIKIEEEALTVSIYDDEKKLLQGVTAEDDRDGDITDSIIIEKKSSLSETGERVITYAAFDGNGNVGRAERKVKYTDLDDAVFKLNAPLRFPVYANLDLLSIIEAENAFDGDLTSKIKCSVDYGFHPGTAGVYNAEYSVTDSTGKTFYLPVEIEIYDEEIEEYTIELSEYLVYLEKGASFNPYDYYVGTDYDGKPEVESNVNTSEAGVYTVKYTVGSGKAVGGNRLIVVVTE